MRYALNPCSPCGHMVVDPQRVSDQASQVPVFILTYPLFFCSFLVNWFVQLLFRCYRADLNHSIVSLVGCGLTNMRMRKVSPSLDTVQYQKEKTGIVKRGSIENTTAEDNDHDIRGRTTESLRLFNQGGKKSFSCLRQHGTRISKKDKNKDTIVASSSSPPTEKTITPMFLLTVARMTPPGPPQPRRKRGGFSQLSLHLAFLQACAPLSQNQLIALDINVEIDAVQRLPNREIK